MPRTVLLADDSVTAQNMGRRILTDAGYEVITVNNGSAALKKIHEVRPDLIVLDVYMPGYGGLEVCQRLKESGDTSKIPVLLTVGKMEPFKADEAKRVRADAHIVKPFEASELLAALAKLEDRIVPQETSRGRKSKKPSFWHDDDSKASREWSDNAEYLAQVKERKSSSSAEEIAPEPVAEEPAPAASPKIGAFPLVHEATGELPVVPDSGTSDDQSTAIAQTAAADEKPQEPAASKVAAEAPADKQTVVEKETRVSVNDENKTAPSAPRWVAENVALSPEEAALELEQEMRAAEAAQTTPAPPAIAADAKQPEAASTDTQGAVFAAAAGASGSGSVTSAVASPTNEAEPAAGSAAAAAWENWQQIRETVMNAHSTDALAESVAQAAKATVSAEGVAAASQPESPVQTLSAEAASAQDEQPSELDGDLASIVDTVLAELKPKLMREISKKLKK
ncbi:MAG TPA: response regulator [Terriglobales bacterium]|nr:response regulator [Terriglobales bacterium]